jgi:hypothetical protein
MFELTFLQALAALTPLLLAFIAVGITVLWAWIDVHPHA